MNIHEYQAKSILKRYNVAIPEGAVVDSPDAAVETAKKIRNTTGADTWAVKAQIHAGGRGKGGGVKIAGGGVAQDERPPAGALGVLLDERQHAGVGEVGESIVVHQVALSIGQGRKGEVMEHVLRYDHQVGRGLLS